MLQEYDWPGNVRELANLIERLAIQFPHGVVDSKDLPLKYQALDPVDVSAAATAVASMVDFNQLPGQGIDMK
jgi:sigma-54 specific flagellar transcriptional regulator A